MSRSVGLTGDGLGWSEVNARFWRPNLDVPKTFMVVVRCRNCSDYWMLSKPLDGRAASHHICRCHNASRMCGDAVECSRESEIAKASLTGREELTYRFCLPRSSRGPDR